MDKLRIPHNALVFVGDGRKALFLRNDGDKTVPNLKTERVFEDDNPPSHEQGTDRPGHLGKGSHPSEKRGRADRLARYRGASLRAEGRCRHGAGGPGRQGESAHRGGSAKDARRFARRIPRRREGLHHCRDPTRI